MNAPDGYNTEDMPLEDSSYGEIQPSHIVIASAKAKYESNSLDVEMTADEDLATYIAICEFSEFIEESYRGLPELEVFLYVLPTLKCKLERLPIVAACLASYGKQENNTCTGKELFLVKNIDVKRNTVALYEVGKIPPSSAVLSLICREFHVNETWLCTGEGEMFLPENEELFAGRHCP